MALTRYLYVGVVLSAQDQMSGTLGNMNRGLVQTAGNTIRVRAAVVGLTMALNLLAKAGKFFQNILAQGVKEEAEFESTVVTLGRVTGLTGNQVDDLRSRFIQLSSDLPLSANQLGEAAVAAGRMGVAMTHGAEGVESLSFMSAKLAAVIGTTEADTVQMLGRMAKVTNTNFNELENLGSALLFVDQSFATTAPEIAEVVNRVGGLATAAGVSSTDIMTMAGSLLDMGVSAQRSGTVFQRLFQNMADPRFSANFAKFIGMPVEQFTKQLDTNATPVITEMLTKIRDLPFTQQAEALKEFGLQGRPATGIIQLSKNADKLRQSLEMTNKVYGEGASLGKAFALQNETLGKMLATLVGSVQNLRMELAKQLYPIIKPLLSILIKFVNVLVNASPEVKRLMGLFLGIATVLGIIAGALAAIIGVIGGFAIAITAAGGFAAIMGIITTAVTALAAALPYILAAFVAIALVIAFITYQWQKIQAIIMNLWENLKLGLMAGLSGIKDDLMLLKESFKLLFDTIWKAIMKIFPMFQKQGQEAGSFLKTFGLIVGVVVRIITNIISVLINATTTIYQAMMPLFAFIGHIFTVIFEKIRLMFNLIASVIMFFVDLKKHGFITAISNFFGNVFGAILNQFIAIINSAIDIMNTTLEAIPGVDADLIPKIPKIATELDNTLGGLGDAIKSMVKGVAKQTQATEETAKNTAETAGILSSMITPFGVQRATPIAPTSGAGGVIPVPAFQEGGLVTRPTIAQVGEVPEIIAPIDKLASMMSPNIVVPIVIELDGKEIARYTQEMSNDDLLRSGGFRIRTGGVG